MMKDLGYLFICDFDGTMANTFEKCPDGVGVSQAYEMAIEKVLGTYGMKLFNQVGGLQNRAPEEVVHLIFEKSDNKSSLFKWAEACFDAEAKTLQQLVPQGKGFSLEWKSNQEELIKRTITEMLVLFKLSFLMKQVGVQMQNGGQIWPRPCKGFLAFYELLPHLEKITGKRFQFAILSSGHDEFIKKTFEAWDIDFPVITVTDDDMRNRRYPSNVSGRVKPSPFLLDLIQSKWIGDGIIFSEYARHIELMRKTRKRMILFGDDPKKDGVLAENAEIPFGLFKPSIPEIKKIGEKSFIFGDWAELMNFFLESRSIELFKKGCSFDEIISF